MTSKERQLYISNIHAYGQTQTYIPFIIDDINNSLSATEKVDVLIQAITNNPNEFSPFINVIRSICLTSNTDGNSDYFYKVYCFAKTCELKFRIPLKSDEARILLLSYVDCLYSEYRDLNAPAQKLTELKTINSICDISRSDKEATNLIYAFLLVGEMSNHTDDKGACVFNGHNPNPVVNYSVLTSRVQQSLIEAASKQIAEYWLNTKKLPFVQYMFVAEDDSSEMKAYSYLFGDVLDCVIASNSKNRSDVMVGIIEYAIYLRLTQFLEDVPEMLVYKVKVGDILKPLEKDLELKTRLKANKGLLAEIETTELQQQVNRIREAYEKKSQNSAFGRAKQALGSFMSGFKKGKKDDQ